MTSYFFEIICPPGK